MNHNDKDVLVKSAAMSVVFLGVIVVTAIVCSVLLAAQTCLVRLAAALLAPEWGIGWRESALVAVVAFVFAQRHAGPSKGWPGVFERSVGTLLHMLLALGAIAVAASVFGGGG